MYNVTYNCFSAFVLPFDEVQAITAAIIIYPLCVFGVLGNATTIYVVAKSVKLK